MVTDDQKRLFAARLNEALDDFGFPGKGAGRQGQLGAHMKVSQKGARKWLEGESMPTTSRIMALANWLDVNFEWLSLQGNEKKRRPPSGTKGDETRDIAKRGTSYTAPVLAEGLRKIQHEIDRLQLASEIGDDDAILLRAALRAVQADMSPGIRAAILLMLDAQYSREGVKDASNPRFKVCQPASHSGSEKVAESPASFTRNARAGIKSVAQPESDDDHDTGKQGK